MTRIVRTIAALLLIAGFLLPLAGYVAGKLGGDGKTGENRALAAWPAWNASARNYTAGIDAHLADRFGGRMALIRLARDVKDNLGEDAPQAVRGQGGWLFLGEDTYRDEFEGVGAWADAQVEVWAEDIGAARAVFHGAGIPFVVAIAPDKVRIYPEQAPESWRESGRRFASRVTEAAALTDLEPAIQARKDAGETVYWARDTHWTASGAWAAAQVLLNTLDPQGELPRYDPAPAERRQPDKLYDLEAMLGEAKTSEPASLRIKAPHLPGYAVTRPHVDADGTPVRGALSTIIVTDTADFGASGTLVIVGDSFADNMIPLLKPTFARVVRIHHGAKDYTVGTDEVLSYDPDAVMFLIVERSAVRKSRPLWVGPSRGPDGSPLPLPRMPDAP